MQLSLTGCQNFSDHELDVLIQSLPAELRFLRLDLGFSGLETLDMFTPTVQCLKSLFQLKLRFTGSSHFRTAEGLGVAMRAMENLMYLELWRAELCIPVIFFFILNQKHYFHDVHFFWIFLNFPAYPVDFLCVFFVLE